MKVARLLPAVAFALILGAHTYWSVLRAPDGDWASFTKEDGTTAPTSYLAGEGIWLGLSYAAAGAFAAFGLTRFHQNRKRAIAGAAGGVALAAFLYMAGCYLLGCCGSPMLAVYLGLFGPRFLKASGPLVLGITLASVAIGYLCLMRKRPGACACDADPAPSAPEPSDRLAFGAGCASSPRSASCCPGRDSIDDHPPLSVLRMSLEEAAAAKKCWSCGCALALADAAAALPSERRPPEIGRALAALRSRLQDVECDCRGCTACAGAQGLNALAEIADTPLLPAEEQADRAGWPPRPGDYRVLRYHAPVALCTLTDASLACHLAESDASAVSIVGTLQTENLGIERIVANVTANPNLRFLILCGADSRERVGHLPGQSLLCLARNGMDAEGRIIGAPGRRPVLRNVAREVIEHFRANVEVIDRIGECDAAAVVLAAESCAARAPGPAEPLETRTSVERVEGFLPERVTPDPAGYLLILVDRRRRELCLEHYTNGGVLDAIVTGRTAPELYTAAFDREFVSRLDHAAYLGRELARAERALRAGEDYVQDAAPERNSPQS